MSKRLRIIFMGTPAFAVPSLECLMGSKDEIAAVVTRPDKRSGRGRKMRPSPVKAGADRMGIRVLEPHSMTDRDFIDGLKDIKPHLIVVVAYGKILPTVILDLPGLGCINLHASLLPKYRGAAPINWALINGEKVTGVTTIAMDEGMDCGDILLQKSLKIDPDDTADTLSLRLAPLGAELLKETLREMKDGRLKPMPQDHRLATFAPSLKKGDGIIDWGRSAEELKNFIRGMNPWPGSYTYLNDRLFKIYNADTVHHNGDGSPGEVVDIMKEGMFVSTSRGILKLREVQLEGKRRMNIEDFLRGYSIKRGEILGRK